MPISALLAERANREIKRRTDVVQCFPSKDSLLRLVGAVLCEENVRWSGMRMFSEDSIAEVDHFVAPEPTELEIANAQTKAREIVEKAVEIAEVKGVESTESQFGTVVVPVTIPSYTTYRDAIPAQRVGGAQATTTRRPSHAKR